MAAKIQSLHFERSVAAPITQVYQAFTKSVSLREWLSDTAEVQARLDGLVSLTWRGGQYVVGRYTKLEKNEEVQLSWQSSFGPPSSQTVQVELTARDDATELKLMHGGLVMEQEQDIELIKAEWESRLDNLKSVLESGIDLRLYQRPMLGILVERLITPEIAAKQNLADPFGLELSGVVEGMGADELGMEDGTIITKLSGIQIKDYDTLNSAIDEKSPNDHVPVDFYQDGEKHHGELRLAARLRPEIPTTPQSLAEAVAQIYGKINNKLDKLFVGVSEQAAAHKADSDEWSAREVLAHLIAHEQHLTYWGAALEKAKGTVSYTAHHHQLVAAISNTYLDITALRGGLEQIQRQNVIFLEGLPVEFVARKGSYHRLALNFLDENKEHAKGHFDQIVKALQRAEAAKVD